MEELLSRKRPNLDSLPGKADLHMPPPAPAGRDKGSRKVESRMRLCACGCGILVRIGGEDWEGEVAPVCLNKDAHDKLSQADPKAQRAYCEKLSQPRRKPRAASPSAAGTPSGSSGQASAVQPPPRRAPDMRRLESLAIPREVPTVEAQRQSELAREASAASVTEQPSRSRCPAPFLPAGNASSR